MPDTVFSIEELEVNLKAMNNKDNKLARATASVEEELSREAKDFSTAANKEMPPP